MFDHISKHPEESWKYDAQRGIFEDSEVFENVVKLTNWRQFFMRLSCYWS